MENNMTNGTNAELEAAKAMFSDWKNTHKKTAKVKKVSKEEALKKHFVPREERETFRPIHPKITEKYVKTAFFHDIYQNKAGGKKQKRKVYCPAHNDAMVQAVDDKGALVFNEQQQAVMIPVKCPLCEESKRLLSIQDKSILTKVKAKTPLNEEEQKIKTKNDKLYAASKKLEAKQFFMVKGIDRGREKDGPKFWRFKDHYKQQGVGDKLIPLLNEWSVANGIHFANKDNGIDVNVNVIENQAQNSNYTYKDVSAISTNPRGPSPLHHDESIVNAWLADTTTWRDVYKPVEFSFMNAATLLNRLATVTGFDKFDIPLHGSDPYWDDTNSNDKKWVFPDPRDQELTIKANTRTTNLDATPSNFVQADDVETNESAAVSVMAENSQPTISTMTKEDVGSDKEDAVNLTPQVQPKKEIVKEESVPAPVAKATSVNAITDGDDIEDMNLPF